MSFCPVESSLQSWWHGNDSTQCQSLLQSSCAGCGSSPGNSNERRHAIRSAQGHGGLLQCAPQLVSLKGTPKRTLPQGLGEDEAELTRGNVHEPIHDVPVVPAEPPSHVPSKPSHDPLSQSLRICPEHTEGKLICCIIQINDNLTPANQVA